MVVTCNSLPAVSWVGLPDFRLANELAIFRIPIADNLQYAPRLPALLQPEEVRRAGKYHRPADYYRFLIGRAALRIIAGKYTGLPPADIRFALGPNQKPVLKNAPGLHYNTSHSGDWVLLAFAGADVGIDVEKVEALFPFQTVLPHNFSPPEQAFIENSPASRHLFYQCWTRKEALVKATAQGIDADFSNIPALDGQHQRASDPTGAWAVSSFAVAAGYVAAIARPAATPRLRFYDAGAALFSAF